MLRQRNIVHRDLKPQVLPKDILIWSLLVGLGVISPLFLVFVRFFLPITLLGIWDVYFVHKVPN